MYWRPKPRASSYVKMLKAITQGDPQGRSPGRDRLCRTARQQVGNPADALHRPDDAVRRQDGDGHAGRQPVRQHAQRRDLQPQARTQGAEQAGRQADRDSRDGTRAGPTRARRASTRSVRATPGTSAASSSNSAGTASHCGSTASSTSTGRTPSPTRASATSGGCTPGCWASTGAAQAGLSSVRQSRQAPQVGGSFSTARRRLTNTGSPMSGGSSRVPSSSGHAGSTIR